MTKFCALIPLLVAAPAVWGCAGTKPVQSSAGEGGTGGVGTGTGATTGSGGSQVTGTGGGGGDVGPQTDAGTPNCGLYQFQPTPKAADIMMVLDRSGSMQDVPDGAPSGSPSKWSVVVPSLMSVVSATQDSISWGLKTFPEASTDGASDCSGGITKAIDVQVTAMDGTTMNGTITTTTPNGNGTPTPDAITAAANYLATLTDTNPKYLLLATDGEPDCVGTTKNSSTADTAAVTAVGNALKAGFPTFVVGIVTTKQSAITELNLMAKAGGEPIANPNPLANQFYETDLASDPTELTTALKAITGQISTCLFPLGSPPPILNDGTKVGVYVGSNMTRIPYDPAKAKGWAYSDTNDTAIQVFGSWCDTIQAAGAGAVQIIFGCPSINPPG
jgi:hypothetical protein